MDDALPTIPYTWPSLTHDDSIRVLTLFPERAGSSDIHIKLSEERLSDPPAYEALSYCWATEDGDDSRNCIVYCDDGQISITTNCDAALRRLRDEKTRILWIDAICINQADDNERGRQVNLMQDIYKQASSVKIYLGEPVDNIDPETGQRVSDVTADFLAAVTTELKDLLENEDPKIVSPLYRQLTAVLYSATREDLFKFPGFLGMRDILCRRWWRRVWVVQEAILGQDPQILWRQKLIPYSQICDFYSVTKWSGHIYLLKLFLFHEAHFNVLDPVGPGSTPQNMTEHAMRILNILSRVNELQASDPRDKIFGLVGVADPRHVVLPRPDYTKSQVEVFSAATRSLILATKSLQILHQLPKFDPSRSPSWMVDWTLPPAIAPDRLPKYSADSATNFEATCLSGAKDNKQFKVLGKLFDSVRKVSLARKGNDESSLINHWTDICRLGLSLDQYPTGEQIIAVLGRTLTWHRLFGGERDMGDYDYGHEFEKFYDLLTKGKSIREIKESSARGFATILQGSELVLCTTESGYIGMVSDRTRPGDVIALLSGGQSPYVLRSLGAYHQVVGVCYVHGIMKGEAWPEHKRELGQIDLR